MTSNRRSNEYRMSIPGAQELVPDVCDFVAAAARRANLNDRAVYHCQMSVDEACTNIIEHGFEGGVVNGQIEVICQDDDGAFTITIADDSPPFNPIERDDPDPATPLTEREPGGWGIFFIKKMMDAIDYDYQDARNTLTIIKSKTPDTLNELVETVPDNLPTIRGVGPGIWSITPPARLDSTTSPDLGQAIDSALKAERLRLIVDMHLVNYISTSGLKVLVNGWRSAQAGGGKLVLANMSAQVHEVFTTVGFDQVFDIHPTVQQAISALSLLS